jgi:hypothetical protein
MMCSTHVPETFSDQLSMGSTEQSWSMVRLEQEKPLLWVEACKTISTEVSFRELFPRFSRRLEADSTMSTQSASRTLRSIMNLCLTWYHQCLLVNNRGMPFLFKMMPRVRFMSRVLLWMFAKMKKRLWIISLRERPTGLSRPTL